jgi:hypothetical protein
MSKEIRNIDPFCQQISPDMQTFRLRIWLHQDNVAQNLSDRGNTHLRVKNTFANGDKLCHLKVIGER